MVTQFTDAKYLYFWFSLNVDLQTTDSEWFKNVITFLMNNSVPSNL